MTVDKDVRPLRVVHFSPSFLPTMAGAEIVVHNVALAQLHSSVMPTVLTRWRNRRQLAASLPYPVISMLPGMIPASTPDISRVAQLAFVAQLRTLQRRFKFDVWHIHSAYPAGWLAIPVLNALRVPSVLTCHGIDIQINERVGYGLRRDPVMSARIADAVSGATVLTAVSPTIECDLASAGAEAERVVNVPNGVSLSRLAMARDRYHEVRRRRGIHDEDFVILTVGRNHPKKGFDLIPRIAKHVSSETGTPLHWFVVGQGSDAIARAAAAAGLADVVHAVPEGRPHVASMAHQLPDDDIVDLYGGADLFVFPGRMESFGLVIAEAMAAGLPVVTTDAPGCRDFFESGSAGLKAPVDDVEALGAAIKELIDAPERRGRMAEVARAYSKEYSWSAVALGYEQAYQDSLHRKEAER